MVHSAAYAAGRRARFILWAAMNDLNWLKKIPLILDWLTVIVDLAAAIEKYQEKGHDLYMELCKHALPPNIQRQ